MREDQADVRITISSHAIFDVFARAKVFSSLPLLPGINGLLAIVMVFRLDLWSLVILWDEQATRVIRTWIPTGQGRLIPVWVFKLFLIDEICLGISSDFAHVALHEFLRHIDLALASSPLASSLDLLGAGHPLPFLVIPFLWPLGLPVMPMLLLTSQVLLLLCPVLRWHFTLNFYFKL